MLRRAFLKGLASVAACLGIPIPKPKAELRLTINGHKPTYRGHILESYLKFAQTPHGQRIDWAALHPGQENNPDWPQVLTRLKSGDADASARRQIEEYRNTPGHKLGPREVYRYNPTTGRTENISLRNHLRAALRAAKH